jgi:DNA-binding NarL/FixJ family response regulator
MRGSIASAASERPMKTLLVDDHALFRAGLRMLLKTLRPDAVVLEASTVDEAIAVAMANADLQLCLLDLSLRKEHGLDALQKVRQVAPEVAVVIVSGNEDVATIHACIDAGAMSYIPKSVAPEVLVEALRRVLAGAVWLPDQVHAMQADPPTARPPLTPRQLDVMRCLSRGLPTKSISRELDLSENTIKDHITAIFRGLGVSNRTQAVIEASRLRLGVDA